MITTHVSQVLADWAAVDVPNPAPKAPPGVGNKVNDLISYVKWGVLIVILLTGFVGAIMIAAGRYASHHKSMSNGVWVLAGAVVALVLYAGWFTFVQGW